jgi:NAD-dependent deacetylase
LYIRAVAARLTASARITVLTGAGVSAASGVPTFRGAGGLWRQFRAEDLATPEAFARDPGVVWEWYRWRRGLIAACAPKPAHEVLARWSRRFPSFTLATQNVDGLHEAAGTEHLLRLHGSIWQVRCARPCARGAEPWSDDAPEVARQRVDEREKLPQCPYCGGLARPAVVWFGEALDEKIFAAAVAATRCDVFFTIGTSAAVYPAAGLVAEARRRGAFTVEINPTATGASAIVDAAISVPAEIALPAIDALIAS